MRCGRLVLIVVALAFLPGVAGTTYAQPTPAIETVFPKQLVRGQTTVVHVAIPSREVFQSAEVSPAAGVTIAGVSNAKKAELSQNVAWWDVTIDVARDAAPGTRALALLTASGRSTPAMIVIAGHVPAISDLRVVSATPQRVDVQFSARDESADLGDLPYVWFTIACGGEPTVGVVWGRAMSGTVRATIPRPAGTACDLELRASDAQKNESNSLRTRIQ